MAGPAPPATRTFSLRAHLLLLVIGTLLPVLVVAAFLVRLVVRDNRDAVERRLLEAARAEAAVVDAELDGTIRALQGLSQSDRLTDGDIPAFYVQAQRLLATQPTWAAVSLSTAEGHQIANTTRPAGDRLPMATDRDSFDRAINSRRPAIGNLRAGQITNQLGFVVRVPVVREGRVLYVLSSWTTSRSFGDVLRRRQPSLSEEWVRGVVDAGGVLVARSHEADRFVGQKVTPAALLRYAGADEGVFRDVSRDGVPVYGAFSRAPLSRWVAAVAVPAAIVDKPFRQSMIAVAAVGLLVLAVGGGGTYLISRRISRDISKSAAEAEAIARGLRGSQPQTRVTELQRLLDALARSSVLLETRQRERDEQVARADAARATAEAADRAKDEFLAMLGHELRNPLAPALTAIHLMKLRGADATRERDVVERQIQHMARLVEDLLDVSRLRRGAIELRRERVDVADAVARAVEMTAPLFAEKRHHLELDVPTGFMIDADRIRIAQVLSNILSNAAKYTEPGGRVVVRAHAQDDCVAIECRDSGIGIPADLVPRVFDLFVQGQRGLDRRQGGLGLGLAVARTLVELHGGGIEAKSDGPNQGSTLIVRLPRVAALAVASSPAPDDSAPKNASARIGRVMVVDDNRDALDMLLETLKLAGVEVFGASTSNEALALAERIRPAVALLDIGLPDMDGFALGRALRSVAAISAIRLVALTGYGRDQDRAAARAAGFDAFLVKPVDLATLLDTLDRLARSAAPPQVAHPS